MGHRPATAEIGVAGMKGVDTHTSPMLFRRLIEQAWSLRPDALAMTWQRAGGCDRAT